MKKTLQHELKVNNGNSSSTGNGSGLTIALLAENDKLISDMNAPSTVVMDDVNFKYLKHVILKFLTSREVRILILQITLYKAHEPFTHFFFCLTILFVFCFCFWSLRLKHDI